MEPAIINSLVLVVYSIIATGLCIVFALKYIRYRNLSLGFCPRCRSRAYKRSRSFENWGYGDIWIINYKCSNCGLEESFPKRREN